MSQQLFKNNVSNDILFSLLEKICNKVDNKYYIVNKISFKQAIYYSYIIEFCNILKDYYYPSKQYYITRKLDYNKFTTIIRHICKANNINYISKIKYDKSNYDIIYYIYL